MLFDEFIKTVRSSFGEIPQRGLERFRLMESLYSEWNSKINVISRKDIGELYSHHVLHSLAIAEYVRMEMPDLFTKLCDPAGNTAILDIGTGGGFPGIPLAVLFPGGRFTLCDSIGKKTKVAADVAARLGLDNVTVVNSRAENLPGKFDYIVSRAVTSIDNFLPWTRKKFSEGIFCLKGGNLAEELGLAMQKFHLRPGSVHTFRIDSWLKDPYFEGKMVVYIDDKSF